MTYCPACGEEYREGYTHCPDCNILLTKEKPPPPDDGSLLRDLFRSSQNHPWPEGNDGQPERPVLLRSYDDRIAFHAALTMLKGLGIPALDGTLAVTAHLRVFLGSYLQAGDIYVPESLREDALILLDGGGEPMEEE